jgi:hypothetical protein
MLRFTEARRRILVEKLPDTGNLALAALVFGQFVGSQPFSPALAVAGLAIRGFFFAIAYLFGGGE